MCWTAFWTRSPLWRQRAITRRELARLDDRMLHDIGISQIDVEGEISKPFWKA